ncbi:uncharacterized protein A4U43_C10F9530 [Asparagus officinalis]|uniref:Replication protein A OB domain-containing protein n=1 Tax=Asparagus officinalis TaxID=4686 RepID=A0A5P1E1Z6_ASPOF|nr:uncharacterized protein A4U43_C10F9530 [Asparagus officinalis]
MSRFHPILEEDSIHVLSKFRVIHSFDIIGIVKEIYPLELTANGQKSYPRRSLKLIDESNVEIKATLWSKLAVDLESKLQNQDPNNMVMIVTGVVINTFRGQFSVSASTGSKVYINIEESHVLELSHREIFPEIIKSIIGKTIKVQVKLTKYNFEEVNESFTVTKLIEAIKGDSQESQEVEVVDLHEEALLQTPKHISKDKVVFTPLTNTPLKPKMEKIFKSSHLRINDLGDDENIQRNSTVKKTEDLKRKRTSNDYGKENWI